jgi:16S rRNA (guanine966-N2)-methyltransferase
MRVVAGALRGRLLLAPPGTATRPTTDRVREAVFNALASRGLVDGARVADLFAGSGALGIEALSRGAEHCTFVERDRVALGVLADNLRKLGLADRSTVVAGDVMASLHRLAGVGLVLADPPYGFDRWDDLLGGVAAVAVETVVAESDAEVVAPAGWNVLRVKRYGRTWITALDRVP